MIIGWVSGIIGCLLMLISTFIEIKALYVIAAVFFLIVTVISSINLYYVLKEEKSKKAVQKKQA